MGRKLFDVYGVIGLMISIIIAFFTLYSSSNEIVFEYIFIMVFGVVIIVMVMMLLNKFSIIDGQIIILSNQMKNIVMEMEKGRENFSLIDKRFKTIEDLNDIRLDIRELKKKIKNE